MAMVWIYSLQVDEILATNTPVQDVLRMIYIGEHR